MTEVLENIGDELIEEIRQIMQDKNLNDSKGTSESLKREATENTLDMRGSEVFTWLNRGRSPGKFAPPPVIQEWVASKLGITGKENKSIAFLVNRKLKEKGSSIYLDNSKGIELDKIREKGVELIKRKIGSAILLKLKSEININLRGMK